MTTLSIVCILTIIFGMFLMAIRAKFYNLWLSRISLVAMMAAIVGLAVDLYMRHAH